MAPHTVQSVAGTMMLWVIMCCSVLAAEDVQERFSERYGERIDSVRQTREVSDDLDLAREMLDEARERTDQPQWLSQLCRHAYSLSRRKSAGLDMAIEAMHLYARHRPEARHRAHEKIASIYRRQFATARGSEREEVGRKLLRARLDIAEAMKAEEHWERAGLAYRKALTVATAINADRDQRLRIRRHREAVRARQRRKQRIEQLHDRVQDQPDDIEATRSLVKLLVITGDPGSAAVYRPRLEDSELKRHLALAAKNPAELTEDEARTLGSWYRELASEEPEPGPAPLLRLAYQCYDRYLHLRSEEDADRREAEQIRDRLRERLDRLDVKPPPTPVEKVAVRRPDTKDDPPETNMRRSLPGRRRNGGGNALFEALRPPEAMRRDNSGTGPGWTELLPRVRLTRAQQTGGWRKDRHGGLEARVPDTADPATLALPVRVLRGSYRLHLRFTVREGAGRLRLIVPAAGRFAELRVATDAPRRSGFRRIEDHAPEQTRLDPIEVQPDRLQSLSVQVTPMDNDRLRLSAGLNGQPLAQWEGPASMLPASLPGTDLPDSAPALALRAPGERAAESDAAPLRLEFSAVNLKLLDNGKARILGSDRSRRAP